MFSRVFVSAFTHTKFVNLMKPCKQVGILRGALLENMVLRTLLNCQFNESANLVALACNTPQMENISAGCGNLSSSTCLFYFHNMGPINLHCDGLVFPLSVSFQPGESYFCCLINNAKLHFKIPGSSSFFTHVP